MTPQGFVLSMPARPLPWVNRAIEPSIIWPASGLPASEPRKPMSLTRLL